MNENNSQERTWRAQAGMVLLELERALGEKIINFGLELEDYDKNFIDSMISRIPNQRKKSKYDLKSLIESVYLDEVFQLMQKFPLDHSSKRSFEDVYNLAKELGVFEIRNNCFHPNKIFRESYWYRVSAFVTDPLFLCLEIESVSVEFRKAQEGTLLDLPEDWLSKFESELPNNLPETYSHRLTGLIGRFSEMTDLRKRILSRKSPFVAVVAPGGYGKTALVLETLEISLNEIDLTSQFVAIIFVSAKTQELAADGIREIAPKKEIEAIESEIISLYHGLIDDEVGLVKRIDDIKQPKNILLFIDNMEEILVRSPKAFE